MFDSHCHLDFPELDDSRPALLAAARDAGIQQWFVPGCAPEQWPRVRALSGQSGISGGYGVHPWWAHCVVDLQTTMTELRQALVGDRVVALGECGLDEAHASREPFEHQVRVFEAQLELARQLELPLVLHQVRARQAFLASLERVGLSQAGAVVHGFSGDLGWAQTLTKRGVLLGVGPSVLRSGRERLRAALAEIPLDRLLVETDAPDQGVSGNRGRPLDLLDVVTELARIRGLTASEVGRATAQNAGKFFGRGDAPGV